MEQAVNVNFEQQSHRVSVKQYALETMLNVYSSEEGATFSYSYDGRNFNGQFESRVAAIADAFDGLLNERFIFVAKNVNKAVSDFLPTSTDILNVITRKVECESPIAADSCRLTFSELSPDAEKELEQAVIKTLSGFLSIHGIDISLNDIENVQKLDSTSGELIWSEITNSMRGSL
jgi:hypothetical protein